MRPISKSLRPKFSPARLFAAGAQGAWYDPSSLWGAGDHLPRRNLLTNTVFTGAVAGTPGTAPTGWAFSVSGGTTGIAGEVITFSTSGAARHFVLSPLLTLTAGVTYTYSVDVTSVSGSGTDAIVLFVPASGSVSGTTSILTSAGTGRKTIEFVSAAGATGYLRHGCGVSGNTVGAASVSFKEPMFATTATLDQSYQKITGSDFTTEQYAWAAAKNVPWLRRNALLNTEDFTQTSWTKSTFVTAPSANVVQETATTSVHVIGTGSFTAGTYVVSARIKKVNVQYVTIGLYNSAGVYEAGMCIDLDAATAITGSVGSGYSATAATVTDAGSGYYDVSVRCTVLFTSVCFIGLRSTSYSSGRLTESYAGNVANQLEASRVLCMPYSGVTPTYQAVGASWEATFAANAAAAGVVPTMYQDSAGTTPVTGPDSVIGFLGDLSQGYTLGSELVTNGTFTTDTTGWNSNNGATLSVEGGELKVVSGTASAKGADQQFSGLEVGARYKLTASIRTVSGIAASVRIVNAAKDTFIYTGSDITSATATTVEFIWSPMQSNEWIYFRTAVAGTFYVDNVSVKKLPGYHAIQSGATGLKPTLRLSPNGYWYIQRDLSDDALVTTFPNLGSNCALYLNDGSTATETTGITLNGALTQSTPAFDYGRIYLNAPTSKLAQLTKWLKAKAGLV